MRIRVDPRRACVCRKQWTFPRPSSWRQIAIALVHWVLLVGPPVEAREMHVSAQHADRRGDRVPIWSALHDRTLCAAYGHRWSRRPDEMPPIRKRISVKAVWWFVTLPRCLCRSDNVVERRHRSAGRRESARLREQSLVATAAKFLRWAVWAPPNECVRELQARQRVGALLLPHPLVVPICVCLVVLLLLVGRCLCTYIASRNCDLVARCYNAHFWCQVQRAGSNRTGFLLYVRVVTPIYCIANRFLPMVLQKPDKYIFIQLRINIIDNVNVNY